MLNILQRLYGNEIAYYEGVTRQLVFIVANLLPLVIIFGLGIYGIILLWMYMVDKNRDLLKQANELLKENDSVEVPDPIQDWTLHMRESQLREAIKKYKEAQIGLQKQIIYCKCRVDRIKRMGNVS